MCRWLAYSGSPLRLEELLVKRDRSLIDQSLHSRLGATTTNGDGFGVGWYDDTGTPRLYRSTHPAWNDRNLRELAAGVSSPIVRNIILGSSLFSSAARRGLKAVDHIAAAARGCVAERLSADISGNSKTGRTDLLHHLLEISKNKGGALDFGKGEVEYEAYVAMCERVFAKCSCE